MWSVRVYNWIRTDAVENWQQNWEVTYWVKKQRLSYPHRHLNTYSATLYAKSLPSCNSHLSLKANPEIKDMMRGLAEVCSGSKYDPNSPAQWLDLRTEEISLDSNLEILQKWQKSALCNPPFLLVVLWGLGPHRTKTLTAATTPTTTKTIVFSWSSILKKWIDCKSYLFWL